MLTVMGNTDKEKLKVWLIQNKKYLKMNNIEKSLGISHNTLNKFISENEKVQRELPNNWVEPLLKFIRKTLNI